jgi:uncharacterized protein (DUF1697 family)
MALVVLLRGVNVAGQKTFRPTALVKNLKHLDIVNIGAAGTFVVRKPISRTQLRVELARRLPFDADIVICHGREIHQLITHNPFLQNPLQRGAVRCVSVLSRRPRLTPSTPITFPSTGKWLLKVLSREGRFVFGLYRRHMKVIGYLGELDRIFGVRATTRSWNTMAAIANVLTSDH